MLERIIVVFLDGVGLGQDAPQINPFSRISLPRLGSFLQGQRIVSDNQGLVTPHASLFGLDACMGVPGLPQSGTAQTTLLTGINAAARLGRHDGPYPNQELRQMLAADNLFIQITNTGQTAAYANAYSDRFLERRQRGTQRLSANTRAAVLAGLRLRGPEDLKNGRAVSAFLTNEYFLQWGYKVPNLTAAQSGAQLARLAQDYHLTFFELWYTDVAGHHQDWPMALQILGLLDEFVGGMLDVLDLDTSLLFMVSDHGNMEDLSTAGHTENPALGLLIGSQHNLLSGRMTALTDVTPTLFSALNSKQQKES